MLGFNASNINVLKTKIKKCCLYFIVCLFVYLSLYFFLHKTQ